MSVSIIIPTFNEAKLIERTLLRLKERAGDAEILVVDGESTDDKVHPAKYEWLWSPVR
jgi:glycosyltransferase involved in cell wall biosynthesis